jgi:ring-1,2-phenylacetyl-CoA epoxidase subunit PaaD
MNEVLTRARAVAAAVCDPEVPVLTIEDLGVLRDVRLGEDGGVEVVVTPTYSGCPAMDAIREDLRTALTAAGFAPVRVVTELAPAWTTEWMSPEGRRKLAEYGIAPPRGEGPRRGGRGHDAGAVPLTLGIRCPQCGSPQTRQLFRFGSTACLSQWVCEQCREPFDHFKDH